MMRLLLVTALTLAVFIVVTEQKKRSPMLLGADDVDKKHAEMAVDEAPKPPKTLHEVKQKVRKDRNDLKSLRSQAHTLKAGIRSASKSKAEKDKLRQEYAIIKASMRAKKSELSGLKQEVRNLKRAKKNKQGKRDKFKRGGHRNKKSEIIGAEEKLINDPTSWLKGDSADKVTLTKAQKKALKKQSRKGRRNKKQRNKGFGDINILDVIKSRKSAESPKLRSGDIFGRRFGHKKKRIRCTSDSDCLNGARCFTNRKGKKFCKGNGMDKTEGKKCHRSEQCARGLKCYVKNKPGKPHRKKKGICADPLTADLTTGSFMPFKSG